MRRFLILLFFVLAACLAQTSEARKLALLVGVNQYDNVASLRCCVNDMKALKAALMKVDFQENDIVILTTGGDIRFMPTKEKIEQKIAEILAAAQPDDLVFFAFSGHGARENAIDYFCPPFAKPENLNGTCVSITKVMSDLSKCKARFKWVVVDACRNDPNSRDTKAFQVLPVPPQGIALFQSCNKGEKSYEERRADGNGYFTKNLVVALSGKADQDQDGKLTLLEVCTFTSTHTKAEVEKMENEIQIPFINVSAPDFPLFEDLNVPKAKALVEEARKAKNEGKYTLAIEKFNAAIKLCPNVESWINERDTIALVINPLHVSVPDNYSTIAEAYKNVKDGGIITIQPGKYELPAGITVNKTVTFRGGSGRAEDVIIECSSGSAFFITGGSPSFQNITVNCSAESGRISSYGGFVITGGTPKLFRCIVTSRKGCGIYVLGEKADPKVESCTIKNCGKFGVVVYDKGFGKFTDCEIYGNALAGIQVKESGNPTVTGCKIHDGKQSGVFVTDNGLGKFSDCEIYGNALSGIEVRESGNPTFTGCKIHDGKGSGVIVWDNGLGKFSDCDIYSNAYSGIEVRESGNPTFTGCKIHDGKSVGVYVHDKGIGTFSDCEIYGNAKSGIEVRVSGNPTVTGCKIHDGKGSGVFVWESGLGTFTDCEIYGNALVGISVRDSGSNPTVTGCKIHDGKFEGIFVYGNGLGKFSDCDIYGNAKPGIVVGTYGDPTVTGCKIHDGKQGGVYISYRGNGTFNNNKLENNYVNGKLTNWITDPYASFGKGSGNTPPIPSR